MPALKTRPHGARRLPQNGPASRAPSPHHSSPAAALSRHRSAERT